MITKISNREKNQIINISSMAIVCILVIIILFLPKGRKISLYNKEITVLKKVIEKLNQIDKNPSEFDNKKNKIINNMNIIQEKVPSQPMIPQIVEQITKSMKGLGGYIAAITPLEPVKKRSGAEISEETPALEFSQELSEIEAYIETPIEISIQAAYEQLGMYLDKLRHITRLIIIKEFDIKENKEITPKLDIKLRISVFHYGEE